MTPSKAVLITGCSSGIGQATAKHLNARGWTVYATARRRESLADLREAGCETLALDVTDEDSMRAAVETVEAREGAVGVLVNNAGYSQSGAIETVSMDAVRAQFETNVFGLARMCQLVLPGMRAQGAGKIVNLSSMGGRFTFPGGGYYHASKHAVEAISDALRFEVRGFGVRVIIIEPGLIRTRFGESAVGSMGAPSGTPDDGRDPYAEFNAAVGSNTVDAYEVGPIARLGGPPEAVARKIEKAICADRPRTRYTVTPSAKFLLGLHAMLPDRGWDAFVSSQFPTPGKPEKATPST
jgi:NAD(P)-dependent dehydrogenase (short-subunit alcohol dehydrogenase family)